MIVIPIVLLGLALVSIPDFTLLFLPDRLSWYSALAHPITKFHTAVSFFITTLLFLVDFGASFYFIQRDNYPANADELFEKNSHISVVDDSEEGLITMRLAASLDGSEGSSVVS